MKKNISIVILLVLIAMGGYGYYRYNSVDLSATITMAGFIKDTTLEITKGTEVSVKHGEKESYILMTKKEVLKEGDFIKVGENSEAVINWVDDSVTRLANNTEIHITQLVVDAQDPTATGIQFDIFNGDVWVKAMNVVNDKAKFAVRNAQDSQTIAGLRGTVFDFSVRGTRSKIRAYEHAIMLTTLGVDVVEGEEVTIGDDDTNANANTNGSNGNGNTNTNGSTNRRVNVHRIPDDIFQSDWYRKNRQSDQQYNDALRQRMIQEMQNNVQGVDDPIRAFKMGQMIDGEQDVKQKIKLLMQRANESLQVAILAATQKDQGKAQSYWDRYEQDIKTIIALLPQVTDSDFLASVRAQIRSYATLWLRYSALLIPSDTEVDGGMQGVAMDMTLNEEEKKRLKDLYDTHNFFQMSDDMRDGNNASDIQRMLDRYKALLAKLQSGTLAPFECRILLDLRDKLIQYVSDLPAVFTCNQGNMRGGSPSNNNSSITNQNGNGSSHDNVQGNQNAPVDNDNTNASLLNRNVNGLPPRNTNVNRPRNANVNRPLNLNVNKPVDDLFLKLKGMAANTSCDSGASIPKLRDILVRAQQMAPAQLSELRTIIQSVVTRCIGSLRTRIDALKAQLVQKKGQLDQLPPEAYTLEVAVTLKNSVAALKSTIAGLEVVLQAFSGF